MRYSYTSILALAAGAAAQSRGFNYGALDLDGSPRTLQDFTDQFNAAKALPGTNGQFTSARLFTMLQAGASNQVISAIQAAIDTDTTLLLGLWASQNQDGFNAELGALQSAITQFGEEFTSRVVGISVGSEDLYRISPTGILNESGIGQSPDTLVSYINQVRELIGGGPLANAPIGHVDTWTAWVNGSNSAVVNAVDWLGTDAYPYFQNTEANGIENGGSLFFAALDATRGAAGGKPVWVTETGWPVEGPDSGAAQSGNQNARTYWEDVACPLLSSDTNLWWFTLDDDQATSDDVSFSLVNPADLFGQPLFDLSCSAAPSSSSATASSTAPVSSASSVPASSVIVSVDPIPGSVSSTLSSFATVPVSTSRASACTPKSASGSPGTAAPAQPTGGAAEGPNTVYSTAVVPAPAPTSGDASAPAASTPASTEPATFDGGAARVAGGAAAGLAAAVAFFL